MTRSELREVACKVLYQTYIFDNAKLEYDVNILVKDEINEENEFVIDLVNGVKKNQDNIKTLANKYLINWEIDRLSKIDKAILSVGIYEIMYTDTPFKVVIDEALNISHKYSDDNVVKMINGALDGIVKNEKK